MKANVFAAARSFAFSIAVAALVSCGGGGTYGGGGSAAPAPSSPPPMLTQANAQPVASDVLGVSLSFVEIGGSASTGTGVVPFSARPRSQRRTALVAVVRQQLAVMSTPVLPPGRTECDNTPAGFITNDVSGTTDTFTFTNCASGGETISGTLTITNLAVPSDGNASGHVSHNLTIVQPPFPTLTSSGEFDIVHTTAATLITDTLSGGPISLQVDTEAASLSSFNFATTFDTSTGIETDSFSGTITSTLIGGPVTVTTPVTIQFAPMRNAPNTGQLLITGASGSQVKLTVLGDETLVGNQVQIDVDANGDGTFETSTETTWDLL